MGIKRYTADSDTTITNAFASSLLERSRGTGSNMGASDVVEVFSIYDQGQPGYLKSIDDRGDPSSGSVELTRTLVKFPISDVSTARTNGDIPASGSVNFYLRMFNAKHAHTLPRDFKLVISPVSQSWEEGTGLDMEEYKDKTHEGEGANWVHRGSNATWATKGGSYRTDFVQTVTFSRGTEDLETDITPLVEKWIADNDFDNYGLGIRLSASYEGYFSSSTGVDTGSILHNVHGAKKSYYTKKFFARGTEFYFKRPLLEARWDSSRKDDRANFFYSSSLATGDDNLNTLYLYNYVRGQLKDIPGFEEGTGNTFFVSLYSGSNPDNNSPSNEKLALSIGGNVATTGDFSASVGHTGDTGIYSASLAITSSNSIPQITKLFDVWYNASDTSIQYQTGTITPKTLDSSPQNPSSKYVTKITNLKSVYPNEENARFRVHVREKDWNPTIYSKAKGTVQNNIIDDAYYKVVRITDNLTVVNYGTGSSNLDYTRLSFDVSGNYFDFDMSMLETDYSYGIKFAYYVNGSYREQPEIFKFRVE